MSASFFRGGTVRAGDEASDAAATKIAQNHCFCKDAQPSLRSAPRELCVHPRPNRCLPRQFLFFRSPTCSLCPFIFFRRLVQPRDGLQSIRSLLLIEKSQCSQSRNIELPRQGVCAMRCRACFIVAIYHGLMLSFCEINRESLQRFD